jgi:hypothetical protein
MATKHIRIAELAREDKERRFSSIAHLLTVEALYEAFESLRKDASAGVDRVTRDTTCRCHAHERGVRAARGSYPAAIQTGGHSGIEPQLQPAIEVGFRLGGHWGRKQQSVAGVPGESQTERDATRDGSAHSGAEDCNSCSDNLEERRDVRSQETEFDTIAVFESTAG